MSADPLQLASLPPIGTSCGAMKHLCLGLLYLHTTPGNGITVAELEALAATAIERHGDVLRAARAVVEQAKARAAAAKAPTAPGDVA